MLREDVNYSKPTISELFSASNGEKFLIPKYQRGYAWEESNIEKMRNDINETNGQDYLMGTIVFNKPESENVKYIIDGQQRMATFVLLFLALYIGLKEKGFDGHAQDIKELYYKGKFGHKYFILTLGKLNQNFFEKILNVNSLEDLVNIQTDNSSSEKILKGLKKFIKLLNEKYFNVYSDTNILEKQILEFITKILSDIFFIEICVPTYSEASKIFETLNNRGEELSNVDLIKNLLFQQAEEQGFIEDVENIRDQILDNISLDNLEQFFRYYTLGFSKTNSIYDRVDNILKTDSTKTFSNNILRFSEHYDKITSLENIENEEADLIEELNIYGLTQCYSVLMYGKDKFNDSDYIRLLRSIVNLSLKFQIICGNNPNILENLYEDIAKNIRIGSYNINIILEKLKEKEPDKEEFQKKFIKKEFIRNSNIVKKILSKIENHITTGEKIVSIEDVHLEHIMPKNINIRTNIYATNPNYKDLKMTHGEFLNTIGNMTLLRDKLNMKIKNKSFEDKKSLAYGKTEIKISDSLKKMDIFTRIEIMERANMLSEIAYEIRSI